MSHLEDKENRYPEVFSTVYNDKIILNPLDKVVLENTFDQLMEEVWCEEDPRVRTRNNNCEWLVNRLIRSK